MKANKTESISVRVDADLKHEFFEYLEASSMTFSKWIRNAMLQELEDFWDTEDFTE